MENMKTNARHDYLKGAEVNMQMKQNKSTPCENCGTNSCFFFFFYFVHVDMDNTCKHVPVSSTSKEVKAREQKEEKKTLKIPKSEKKYNGIYIMYIFNHMFYASLSFVGGLFH